METGPLVREWWKREGDRLTFGDIVLACLFIPVLVIFYALNLLECVWISIFRRGR